MSRLLDSWNPVTTRANFLPDSEPVLLRPEDPEADSTLSPLAEQSLDSAEAVPFIEIPEPPNEKADQPRSSTSQQTTSGLLFHLDQNQRRELDLAPTSEHGPILELISQYRPAVTALWQELHHNQAQTLILVGVGSAAIPPESILALACGLSELTRPVLLIAIAPDSDLSSALDRPTAPGWNDWLAGLPLDAVVQTTSFPALHYLAPGHPLAATQRRFWTWDWQTRLTELRHNRSLVLWWAEATSPWAFPLAMLSDALCFLGRDLPPTRDPLVDALRASSRLCLGWLTLQPPPN